MAIEAVRSVGIQALSAFRRIGRGGEGGSPLAPPPIGRIEAVPQARRRDESADASQEASAELAPAAAAAVVAAAAGETPAYDRRSASALLPSPGKRDKPSERELQEELAALRAEKAAKDRARLGSVSARSGEVQRVLSALKARDGEVRAHEAAHVAAGGRFITGGASYSYQKGPDGQQYAVGGEVGIDSSPIPGKPEETIAKMRIVRAAALAPAEPSGPDLAVAGAAAQAEASAVAELARSRSEEIAGGGSGGAVAELASQRRETNAEGGSGGAVAELARQRSETNAEGGSGGAVGGAVAGAKETEAYGRSGREKEAEPGSKLDLVA